MSASSIDVRVSPVPSIHMKDVVVSNGSESVKASFASAVSKNELTDSKSLLNISMKMNVEGIALNTPSGLYHVDNAVWNVDSNLKKVSVTDIKIKAYHGEITGHIAMDDIQSGNQAMHGAMYARNIDIASIPNREQYSIKSGIANADITQFSFHASDADIAKSLHVKGSVSLNNALMVNPAWASSAVAIVHGELDVGDIQIKSAKAVIDINPSKTSVSKIDVRGFAADATGELSIENGELSGEIKTSAMGGITGSTLTVSGTPSSPVVLPSVASTAGAVAGTILTGGIGAPVGAVVGAKIGSVVDSVLDTLFSSKKE